MSTTQLHLALTHVPVILSFTGLLFLIGSYFIKNNFLTKVAFFTLAAAALFALPVYFTGEGTEHAIENLPGVSEPIIEEHEELAKIALIVIIATGLLSLAGLFFTNRFAKIIRITVLLLAIGSAGVLAQTAHLGGQIRHSEIRPDYVAAGNATRDTEPNKSQEEDDE